jgi:hypothetical protein
MTEESHKASFEITAGTLVGLHNELADELNIEKERLLRMQSNSDTKSDSSIDDSNTLEYQRGKVIGFELAVSALHAFVVARTADAAGKLVPTSGDTKE